MAKPMAILEKEESPFASKMASNKEIKEFSDRILKLQEERDNISADIRSTYDAAADKGIDRKALKSVVKIVKKGLSDEDKVTVNAYLKALGELPLFAGLPV